MADCGGGGGGCMGGDTVLAQHHDVYQPSAMDDGIVEWPNPSICLKGEVSGVRGVCDVYFPFLHSGVVQLLKVGPVHSSDPLCCPNSQLQSSYI